MSEFETLKKRARDLAESVKNSPDKRVELRKRFYERYGFLDEIGESGYGNSEIAFLCWEVKRGVLDPVSGSPWWSDVNLDFIFLSELGGLVHAEGLSEWVLNHQADTALQRNEFLALSHWLSYLASPSSETWYRAHNCSIITGYIKRRSIAYQEDRAEQIFINVVLYRLLYAQAMVEDRSLFLKLGDILANPALPSVEIITGLPDFYPKTYPLSPENLKEIQGRGHNLEDIGVRILDDAIIIPELNRLYRFAAKVNGIPELNHFLKGGRPIYPDLNAAGSNPMDGILNQAVRALDWVIQKLS